MENASQEFGLFIDNIRSSRNISREDFVEGILSTRQFQRYIKGDSSISIEKILMLVDKLELEFFSTYNRFLKSSNKEHNMINELYNHITLMEFKESYDLILNYKDYNFTSTYYKKLFDLYVIITEHRLLRISRAMAIQYFEESIDYPTCMNNDVLNYIELTSLLYMAQIVTEKKKRKNIMNKLYRVLKDHKISDFGEKDAKMAVVYSVFSKLLGSQEKYNEVIFLTKKGINLCELHKTTNSLAHLYYYCSLGYRGLNNLEEALKYVRKTFFTLEIENNTKKYEAFVKIFESHYKMNFSEYKTW